MSRLTWLLTYTTQMSWWYQHHLMLLVVHPLEFVRLVVDLIQPDEVFDLLLHFMPF